MALSTAAPPDLAPAPAAAAAADVREQLRLLWRSRTVILVSLLLFGGAGAISSLIREREFEASATLTVSASRLDDRTPNRVPPETFVPLMTTQAVAQHTIDELKLQGLPTFKLLDDHIVVRAVPDSSLIKVVARMESPQLAADVANAFARRAITAAVAASRIDVENVEAELKTMLDGATARLRSTEAAYDQFRTTARLDLVKREVETIVDQRAELLHVIVELEAERARLAKLDAELAGRQPVLSLRQSIVDNPALAEVARVDLSKARDLLAVEVNRETENPVFGMVDEEAAKTRAYVAFLEQQRARLTQVAGLNGAQLARLNELYERESVLDRLEAERRIARKSYEAIADRYQSARLAAVGRTPQVLLVDPALPAEQPLSRYLARNALIGVSLGLLLGCVSVFARQAFA